MINMGEFNIEGGETTKNIEGEKGVRRSNRIKTAKRVEKMGGIEYFCQPLNYSRSKVKEPKEGHTFHPQHSYQKNGPKNIREAPDWFP